jgi:NtrC-family two-component system response regulator AlgB
MQRVIDRAVNAATAVRAPWAALVIDDDAGVRQSLRLCLEAAGGRVLGVATGRAALEALERGRFDVVFLDLWLGAEAGLEVLPKMLQRQPDLGVIVVTAYASIENAVNAVKLGAADYVPKPFTPDQVRLAASRVVEAQRLRRRLAELQEALDEGGEPAFFECHNSQFQALVQTALRVAASEVVVLLSGESGSGKTVLARCIRRNSPRADEPFVTVGSPPHDLVTKIQEAEGGTLLLDEVGDLPSDGQSRLVSLLDRQPPEALTGANDRQTNVRVIAATSRDLDADVRAGRFREDLLHRLNVVSLRVPALRERPEDILPLARYYLALFGRKQRRPGLDLSSRAQTALCAHAWPGNVRELRNAIERAVILGSSTRIDVTELGLSVGPSLDPDSGAPVAHVGAMISLDSLEREHIARVVAQSPSLEAAARVLGIDATTLQRKRKRYGLM